MQLEDVSDDFLLELAARGLIPGPLEKDEEFLQRAKLSSPVKESSREKLHDLTHKLFGFEVDWISVSYSAIGLFLWEGAALWTGGEKGFEIQLKPSFKRGSFLGYKLDEVLSHELVHAARCCFEEPEFEEIFAYLTSPSRFRRVFGPLFQSPRESFFFVITSLVACLLSTIWFPFAAFLFLSSFGFFMIRLMKRHSFLKDCRKKLPLSLLVCLSDQEIKAFSSFSLKEISLNMQHICGLRGRLLRAMFQQCYSVQID